MTLENIHRACILALGPCLLTINQLDDTRRPLRLTRVASSDPLAYPVGGHKDKVNTPWTQQVLIRGEVFIGEGDSAIEQAFDDARLILSLGWRCVINQPLRLDARIAGTFNLLSALPAWPDHALQQVQGWAAQWLLTEAGRLLRSPESSRTPPGAPGA
jgi:hypothetical protein